MYLIIRKLWATSASIPQNVKLKLVKTFLIPILSYGGLIYSDIDSASREKLQLCLNNAARFVFGKRKYDHISTYASQIVNNITVHFRIQNLIFLHKLIHTGAPNYLYSKIIFSRSTRTCNITVPEYKYLVSSRLFFVNAAKLWNSLPNDVKRLQNLQHFRLAVTKFFDS